MAKTILIVDDAKTIRDLSKFTLMRAGHTVVEAEDGAQAWQILQSQKPDLIITDLNMPNMNGLELSEKIKASNSLKDLPIFLLAPETSQDAAMRGKQIGILAWIVKPFVSEKLLTAVTKILGA